MNKKSLALSLAFVLVTALFAACGNGTSSSQEGNNGLVSSMSEQYSSSQGSNTSLTPEDIQATSGYAYKSGGVAVSMGENMANLLPALGDPADIFEAPSCAFDGVDKIFYYSGFQINTFPVEGEDFVLCVTLMDDSVTTAEGAYLGMTAEEVKAKQGEATTQAEGSLSYVQGDTELAFLLEDGVVVDISYYLLSQKDSLLA